MRGYQFTGDSCKFYLPDDRQAGDIIDGNILQQQNMYVGKRLEKTGAYRLFGSHVQSGDPRPRHGIYSSIRF